MLFRSMLRSRQICWAKKWRAHYGVLLIMLHALLYVAAVQKLDAHQLHARHVAHIERLHQEHLAHERRLRLANTVVRLSEPRTDHGGTLGCTGLENLWDSAGGSRSSAFIAAEIAMAESGGRQYATGLAGERGYWQINPDHGSLSTYDPYGNARAAVIISNNGRNWTPWTTYVSGAYLGRCLCGSLRLPLEHRESTGNQ